MAFLGWTSDLSVGIGEIDAQHQQLVSLLNELHAAMKQGHGSESLVEIFSKLVDYTRYHFGTEERLFDQYHYPRAVEHKEQHDLLTKQVLELRAQLKGGQLLVSIKTLDFLKGWVTNHIMKTDKYYTEFFHSVGVR